MDLASIIGLIMAMVLMVMGIVTGDAGFSAAKGFLEYKSALITFGGAFSAVLMGSQSIQKFMNGLKSFKLIMKPIESNEEDTIRSIIELSNIARKEGLLSLEESASQMENEFLKKGVLLIVDGTDPELVRSIMETELYCVEQRHKEVIGFWETLGAMGPAWGMIGTLIGLINMLADLSDVSSVGPAMAVALITTFYGSVLANWICAPVATKLKANSASEISMKEVMVEGLLSIQAGENPRVIEEKLKSFLSPDRRESLGGNEGGEE